ncbi:hypothetical protein AB0I00_19580 [Streptomyces sp. NPDC050803]|uniref:hypothetical protein n=1 Tax=unclassified Streptomyces TaxID=2593676 RepID=UPI0034418CF8
MTGGRRWWRWAVAVWAVAVTVGGGLTLWLDDTGEPREPRGRQPATYPSVDADSDCPGPGITPSPRSDGTVVLCDYSMSR